MTAVAPAHPQPGFYETTTIGRDHPDGTVFVVDHRYVEQVLSRPRYEAPKWDIEASWSKICEAVAKGEVPKVARRRISAKTAVEKKRTTAKKQQPGR